MKEIQEKNQKKEYEFNEKLKSIKTDFEKRIQEIKEITRKKMKILDYEHRIKYDQIEQELQNNNVII